jgi:hypothetical protein
VVLFYEAIVVLRGGLLRVDRGNVILEGAGSLAVGMFEREVLQFLLFLQGLVVDSPQVVVLELDVLQLGAEDIHFASILEDSFIVQVEEGFFCRVGIGVLHKRFPNLSLLKDEDFDDRAVGGEELVEVVVGDDVSELVVDADQKDGTGEDGIISASHLCRKYQINYSESTEG